jgi:Fur family peroxide stress response transcriptional regulator
MINARKSSRKREAILDAVRSTKEHPSAEWVYARLKPLYRDLSLGTVYRNFALFRENGDIISVGTVNGQERFDGDTSPHAHFICERCGRVIDVESSLIDGAVYETVAKAVGGRITSHSLTFTGLCRDCCENGD